MKDRHLLFKYIFGLSVCFLFLPLYIVLAGDSPIHFKRLSVDDGLSQNTVLALTQDHNNKIWVGTIDGLNWYEGSRFASYYKVPDDTTSLANNHIYSLHTDREGAIWIGTQVGLSRYNIVGNNFTNYSSPDNQPMQVLAIGEPEEDDYLLLATNIGLMIFNKKTGRMKVQPELAGKTIYSVCRMNDGFLLGTSEGVYFYYERNENVTRLLLQLKGEAIADIFYDDRTGNCWLASLTNGVYCVDNNFQIKRHYNKQNTPAYFLTNSVRTLCQDDKGRIWIGTMEGLLILEPETETFQISRFSSEDPTSLGHNSVRSILKDTQGGMWVGTFYGGLNYYHPLAPVFGRLQHSTWRNSLSDNTVSCIAEEPDSENLWIGTNDGGLNYYNRKTGVFSFFRAGTSTNSLKSDNIKCIWTDKDGSVYIGTHGGGLSRLNRRSGRIETYDFPYSVSLNNSCYSLLDGTDGTLWVGGMNGLYLLDKRTGELSMHPLAKKHNQLENVLIYTLFRDSKGRIWIGTEESLFLYAGGKLEELHLSSSGHLHGLIQAFSVLEDSHHGIWIGTSTGLYCYKEGASTAWGHYTMKDGLPNDFIYCILEDERGRLWLTTNKGLACFNREEGTFLNYTKQDGLLHDQFNYYGAYKTQDGTFFLGSLGGVAYFKPYELGDNPYSPNAVVTGAVVFNQVITDVKSERVRYYQDEQGRMLGMSFPSDQKLFNIRFAVINYLAGKRNQFIYKLEGFETEWNYSRHVSFARASYSNLPPGEYVFKVKACNNNGKWSEATTEYFVHIIPMWYQTWWAKMLFVLFSVGLLIFIIYFFIARAKMKMQVRIEQIERNKVEEISQEKVRFYMNMSHELRTPLSLILAPLEELLGQKSLLDTLVRQKLDYVYRNGRKLLHIVNQLLDFRKAEAGALPIHVALTNVEGLSQDILALFNENAQRRNIAVSMKSDLAGRLLPADKTYLETILMNLLSNAFKFTPDGGNISLSLSAEGETYSFTVRDSGIGMSAEQLTRIFERFYQIDGQRKGTGIGLSLVKMLVEKHHGTITVTSEPNQYTEFKVTLPADINAFTEKERETPEHGAEASVSFRELPVVDEYFAGDISAVVAEEALEDDSRIEAAGEGECSTILLVDDNKEMVDYLKENFRRNYVTLTAGNGEEALAIMKEHRVDIVLSDVMMPGIDGIKLCQLIKRNLQTCHIPVILLSAKGSVDAQTEGIQAGADDYITKPFSIQLLKGKIANQLKARQRLKHYYSNTIDIDTAKMTSNNLDEEFMSKAIQVVEENISNEGFTSDELASKLCMSRSSLYLKMNSVSGEPPANFIRRIRFNKACKLLLEGRYSISEISGMVGFGSSSYFSTSFKKYVGCLPSEYVKQHTK